MEKKVLACKRPSSSNLPLPSKKSSTHLNFSSSKPAAPKPTSNPERRFVVFATGALAAGLLGVGDHLFDALVPDDLRVGRGAVGRRGVARGKACCA